MTKKKSSPPEDEGVKKMLQLLRDHGYPADESSDEKEPINWTAPLLYFKYPIINVYQYDCVIVYQGQNEKQENESVVP